MLFKKYREFFDIDPEYFPQVNESLIKSKPEIWKKFYPHETFVNLLKDTIDVITRKKCVSIWVEGAYGTGKSHSVLTLKKLLDSSEQDTQEYFLRHSDQLGNDLYNKFQQMKSDDKKILTVHRYGSSSIKNDDNLVYAIQESIVKALEEAGYAKSGINALKDSVIEWLSKPHNKNYFNAIIQENYSTQFAGDDVDAIIQKLEKYEDGLALEMLMSNIMNVAEKEHFNAMTLDVHGLVDWIKTIIKENNLKAILFIWDEFTEYFLNNMRGLTGFQELADLSATEPFYFMIVTHNVTNIMPSNDKAWLKILDRFVSPICTIELPENMAFQLMGTAMRRTEDSVIAQEWSAIEEELYLKTNDSRAIVKKKANISGVELRHILPIHPYAALLLKYISAAFNSNQRSMFDFIQNDRGDEIKGFQWFIDNNSPYDEEKALLTIDLLWDFFYEKGKEFLSSDIRMILDSYGRAESRQLYSDDKRVLKTVLLLQAISRKTGNAVDIFAPNEKNLNNAFEGTDLENDSAVRIANQLVRAEILYQKPMGGGKFQYTALTVAGDSGAIEKNKEDIRKKQTASLVLDAEIPTSLTLPGALKLRYEVQWATDSDYKQKLNSLHEKAGNEDNKIPVLITFAKDDPESASINKKMKDSVLTDRDGIIFVDATLRPLGNDLFTQYVEAMANAMYYRKKDDDQANQYEKNGKDVLKQWRNNIYNGEFLVYTNEHPEGKRVYIMEGLVDALKEINKKRYPLALENYATVTEQMWTANSMKVGVECGINRKLTNSYRSGNASTKLEKFIGEEAWNNERYFENTNLYISIIKNQVDEIINKAFEENGRVSIREICDVLMSKPYGFMPCNLTAFVLGFVLKEYSDGSYSWSDNTMPDILSLEKVKEMVGEYLAHQNTPSKRYKDKYIVSMTEEEKKFNQGASDIFGIPKQQCLSIETTRDRIRGKMSAFGFPIWCLKYYIPHQSFQSSAKLLEELIVCFAGIANDNNYPGKASENEVAMNIGRMLLENRHLIDDAKDLFTKEKCQKGMEYYLQIFNDGKLINLAESVEDCGQYINTLRKKFDANDAIWVWNQETADTIIAETISEYTIINESNQYLQKTTNFEKTIREWSQRCEHLKISYLSGKNSWGDLEGLMAILNEIKRKGSIKPEKYSEFLEEIRDNGNKFNQLCKDQIPLFTRVNEYLLRELSVEEIRGVFDLLHPGLFRSEKKEYQDAVKYAIVTYQSEQNKSKLKLLWKEKTGTNSPAEWSKKYRTPILCMVPLDDEAKAREAFAAVNQKNPSVEKVGKALEYLTNASFYDKLSIKEERDAAFRKVIIKGLDVMLEDVDEVRNYLEKTIKDDPYYWMSNMKIDSILQNMAESKYSDKGCEKALEKIDHMNVESLKVYLKELIRNNMNVGIEIIKND